MPGARDDKETGLTLDKALDYSRQLAGAVTPYAWRMSGQCVAFIGHDPYLVSDITKLLPPTARYWTDELPGEENLDIVVIGQEACSTELLDAAIFIESPPRFLPQEGFLDELLFGHDWWMQYVAYLDNSRAYYPGLEHVYLQSHDSDRTLTWRWPSTEAEETTRGGDDGRDRAEIGDLRLRGYQIVGMTSRDRWAVLVGRCLPDLGLQRVAYIIAGHVQNKKRQINGRTRYQHAIGEWESDLARLKREFYTSHTMRFRWPSTEPR